jgi:prepilin-type N-terminal cleavage/methylation domain-containing protein
MQPRRNAGYTLAEILVVVAIIGILSLITVPAFMNFQRAGIFKSAMRTFASDLRAARTNAIKRSEDIRVELRPGIATATGSKEYQAFSSQDGATWVSIDPRRAFSAGTGNGVGRAKSLDGPVWFDSATNLRTNFTGGRPNIVFHPNGTVDITGGGTEAVVAMVTKSDKLFTNEYSISITSSGQIRAWTAQCSDRIDNDKDGFIDRSGVDWNQDGTKEAMADSGCSSTTDNTE